MLFVALNFPASAFQLGQGAVVGERHIDGLVHNSLLVVGLSPLAPDVLLEILVVDRHVLVAVLLQLLLVLRTYVLVKVLAGQRQQHAVRLGFVRRLHLIPADDFLIAEEVVLP